jgi:predicted amidohydrolase
MGQRAQQYGVHVAFGMVAKEKVESIIYNAAVLIGPDGELIGEYEKIHLRGEEQMAFREGYKLPVFETEIGIVGLLLGWDLAFPEVSRSMVLDGAEILCALASWEKKEIDEWRTYVKSRAYENTVFVAGANRVGEDVTMTFGGGSMIVGPRGKVHASLPTELEAEEASSKEKAKDKDKEKEKPLEGYCVARIDLDEVRKFREELQILQARQPTVYRSIVRRY